MIATGPVKARASIHPLAIRADRSEMGFIR
jgi:hypothetical protein